MTDSIQWGSWEFHYLWPVYQKAQSNLEFIALMAALMSAVALSLDALLPALELIGQAVGNQDPARNQWLVTLFFLGIGTGPLLFGPVSDSVGRKPIVYIGFALFIAASLLCVGAKSMNGMLLGRFLQGVALSAPRTISIAMIRDKFSGDFMARIMSFVTVVFILVPVVAPALGKLILDSSGWKAIFYFQAGFGVLVALWFWIRQPETLAPRNRVAFRASKVVYGFREVLQYRKTILYTLVWGLVTGSFLVYLSTSQQIFENQYGLSEYFPYFFAALAVTIGGATFMNGSLVVKYGMGRMISASLLGFTLTALIYVGLFAGKPNPSIGILMLFLCLQFFAIGFLFGNLRAMAMEPLGHIAGLGAAITGFLASLLSVGIGSWIGSLIGQTVLPMFLGFLVCGVLSIGLLFLGRPGAFRLRVTRS